MKKGHDNSQKFKKNTCFKRKKSRLGCIIKNFIIHLYDVSHKLQILYMRKVQSCR